jgi:hypothetical protein
MNKMLPTKNELRIAIFTSLTLIIISSAFMLVVKAIMMSGWHDRGYGDYKMQYRMMQNATEDDYQDGLGAADESMDSPEAEAGM